MKTVLNMGANKTGASRAPALAQQMVAATEEFPPTSRGTAETAAKIRSEYARIAEPLGTMPAPSGVTQLAKTALRAVTGSRPLVLLDKLGERAAFERTGTRLYDALISKHDAGLTFRGGPSRDDLVHVRDEEHQHFLLVSAAIGQLGGDPTVVTPSADLQATASQGIGAVLADPRTNVLQCLEALLTAELVDNDCWAALIDLAENAGETALVEQFGEARRHEIEHLERVRTWLAQGSGRSVERTLADGARTEPQPVGEGARKPRKRKAATASRRRRRAQSTKQPRRGKTRVRRRARASRR